MPKGKQNNKRVQPKKNAMNNKQRQRSDQGATMRSSTAIVPVAMQSTTVSSGLNYQKIRVFERVAVVKLTPSSPTDVALFSLVINPLLWEGTRIQREAALWQQFRFTNLRFKVSSGSATIVGGQYTHGYDMQNKGITLSGDKFDAYMSALPGAVSAPVYRDSEATCTLASGFRSQNWYKADKTATDPDANQGTYFFSLSLPLSGVSTGEAGFKIWAIGDIEFCGRRAGQPDVVTANDVTIGEDLVYRINDGTSGSGAPNGSYTFVSGAKNYMDALTEGFVYVVQPVASMEATDSEGFATTIACWRRIGSLPGKPIFGYIDVESAITDTRFETAPPYGNDNQTLSVPVTLTPFTLPPASSFAATGTSFRRPRPPTPGVLVGA